MKAAAIGINLDTGDMSYFPTEGEQAVQDAHAAIKWLSKDFPDRVFTVACDKEAQKANTRLLLESIGLGDQDPS